ncbi:integral membrane peroxisomal protein importer-2 family [Dorcoceras hygrometricum]|uniref:Integral membrane peroxisomal protein importer-2 family n=1 Tax=Dorcoceras hygrometricum TaxID=472368 RepID=A0A2Z7DCR0_9LAMI|nr:integral membrane peroxisomal protein importer-2 family [Dorcoceras hygrometricum]
MPPRRSILQETGETGCTENLSQGFENPNPTATQIAQLVAAIVEQILANRPGTNPQPDQQAEEIRRLREEVARLKEARVADSPPPAREQLTSSSRKSSTASLLIHVYYCFALLLNSLSTGYAKHSSLRLDESCDWIHSNSWFIVAHDWMCCCLRLVVQSLVSNVATGFPNDWLDQTMSYQFIQTTSFAMHPRLVEYNAEALVWMYKLPAGILRLLDSNHLLIMMTSSMTSSTLNHLLILQHDVASSLSLLFSSADSFLLITVASC